MWWRNKKKEITKASNGTKTKKSKDDDLLYGFLYELAARAAERKSEYNRAENLRNKSRAKYNKVTDLSSFLDEIKYRWNSSPYLGGKVEEGSFMYDLMNTPSKPIPGNFKVFEW